jgi:hypothetical protein
MSAQQPPKPNSEPGSIDFEVTDFDEARRVLDELPPGVAEVQRLMTGNWAGQRRKPLPSDRALTGTSMDWVVSLPAGLRPHSTCEQFPRVINAVADSWDDLSFSVHVIDHMINDYRGGRRGFPVAVQMELLALFEYQKSRAAKR